MKVIGLDGRQYSLGLSGHLVDGEDTRPRSAGHLAARRLLRETFPFDAVYEEVVLPGCEMTLTADFVIPARRLVIEVQGRQHREFIPYFHGNRAGYLRQLKRDRVKREWVAANGLTLVELDDDNRTGWATRLRPEAVVGPAE